MTLESQAKECQPSSNINQQDDYPLGRLRDRSKETEKILCLHCQRTATNGIKCKGICVADSDY